MTESFSIRYVPTTTTFIFIVLIVIVVLLIQLKNDFNSQIKELQHKLDKLRPKVANELLIEIDNGNTYLTTYLEIDKSYILKVGDAILQTPVYDLSYFTDSLKATLPHLNLDKLLKIPTQQSAITPTIFKSKIWIWTGIAAINILIGLLVFKLIKDMQQQKR